MNRMNQATSNLEDGRKLSGNKPMLGGLPGGIHTIIYAPGERSEPYAAE